MNTSKVSVTTNLLENEIVNTLLFKASTIVIPPFFSGLVQLTSLQASTYRSVESSIFIFISKPSCMRSYPVMVMFPDGDLQSIVVFGVPACSGKENIASAKLIMDICNIRIMYLHVEITV